MNIKILDSWLRDYLKTKATPQKIAELLSLSSVSVERLEKHSSVIPAKARIQLQKNLDYIYDIEITTNRPDLMSVIGIAREAAAVLQQNKIEVKFTPTFSPSPQPSPTRGEGEKITIRNNPKLINRICAVVMDVTVKPSPETIKNRLESSDIRSLNNLIDITNYVMRVTGHPTHVFDYDRIHSKKLIIREAKPGEKITTLDKKEYILRGGDIVADDNTGRIVDLLGVMGLENSVVTAETKRILFFVNNNETAHIRKTSMSLGIRTEAAVLNEKDLDPELAYEAFLYGIKLYEEFADGKVISEMIDIYPNKIEAKEVIVSQTKIESLIGVPVSLDMSKTILTRLGFEAKIVETKQGASIHVTPPSYRAKDILIPEDIIEEIARIYGYHNIPNILPPLVDAHFNNPENNPFFWEDRVKDAMKYWGFIEVYTYPMVSEEIFTGQNETQVKLSNPLSEDYVYMRQTLIPSLRKVANENKDHEAVRLFEMGNVYHKKPNDLPTQTQMLAALIRKKQISFYEVKGLVEQLAADLGIQDLIFKLLGDGEGARISVNKEQEIGNIKIFDEQTIVFELNFQQLIKYATLKKTYKPVSKYPPIVEDLSLITPKNILTGDIIDLIKKQNSLIASVSLLDKYEESRTFHIIYQSYEMNLTNDQIGKIREKILKVLQEKLDVKLKE